MSNEVFKARNQEPVDLGKIFHNDVIKMTGRLLLFDTQDKLGIVFPKDCEISIPEKVPVALRFKFLEPNSVVGTATVTKDEKGLVCDVELTNFDREVLRDTFDDELYIGGFYNQVYKHPGIGVDFVDKATLRGIGITFGPAHDELKIVVKEN